MGTILYMKELPPETAATRCSPACTRAYETLSAPMQRFSTA